jgi:hypothetical protein
VKLASKLAWHAKRGQQDVLADFDRQLEADLAERTGKILARADRRHSGHLIALEAGAAMLQQGNRIASLDALISEILAPGVSAFEARLLNRERGLASSLNVNVPQLRRLLVRKWVREGLMPIRTICFPDLTPGSAPLLWNLDLTPFAEWSIGGARKRGIGKLGRPARLTFSSLWLDLCQVNKKQIHAKLHLPGLCPFSQWRVVDRPFALLCEEWLTEMRDFFFQSSFFRILFLVVPHATYRFSAVSGIE